MTTEAPVRVWPENSVRVCCEKCGTHHERIVPAEGEKVKGTAYWRCKCTHYNAIDLEKLT